MVIHNNNYYLSKMSSHARETILSIFANKTNYAKLKKDTEEYYRLRTLSDKRENDKQMH